MKKMLLPAIMAVLAGVFSATAATFVNAKKAATLHVAFVADSVAKHAKDSTTAADSVEKETKKHEADHAAEEATLTPADSIRAAHNEPTTLATATKGVPNAADPKHGAPAGEHAAAPDAHAAAVPSGHDVVPATKTASAPSAKGKTIVPRAVDAAKPAAAHAAPAAAPAPANAPAAIEGALPEGRIAKIFSGMQSKEAAKILEQMNDSDVRVILGRMSDKQAAAILVAFPAARAAAISKGESKVDSGKSAAKSDSAKAPKPAGEHK